MHNHPAGADATGANALDRTILAVQTVVVKRNAATGAGKGANADTGKAARSSTGVVDELNPSNPLQLQTLSAWKNELAADLQTLLAKQVGPVARVMLKTALAEAEHLEDLYIKLSPHIPTEKGRKEFSDGMHRIKNKLLDRTSLGGAGLAKFAGMSSGFVSNPSGAGNNKSSPPPTPAQITADDRDKVEKILTHYVGPIAKILLRKACEQTQNKVQLAQLLCEHLPAPADRTRFLQEIDKAFK
jgi:eukaryotic-like serine/threonine-protein kinase